MEKPSALRYATSSRSSYLLSRLTSEKLLAISFHSRDKTGHRCPTVVSIIIHDRVCFLHGFQIVAFILIDNRQFEDTLRDRGRWNLTRKEFVGLLYGTPSCKSSCCYQGAAHNQFYEAGSWKSTHPQRYQWLFSPGWSSFPTVIQFRW